MKKPEV